MKDEALLPSVALVEEALRKRFGEDPRVLLKRLSEKRPPSMDEAARLSANDVAALSTHSLLQESEADQED